MKLNIYNHFGAALISIAIIGLMLSFTWSAEKSPDCHSRLNPAVMKTWNISPEAATLCDRGDDMANKVWWGSIIDGAFGLVFSYVGIIKNEQEAQG